MYDVLSIQKEETVMIQKYSEKATSSPKKQNKREKKEETYVT